MADPSPLSDEEAVQVISAALVGTGGRALTREADLFLATVAAECLVDRLTLAGIVLMTAPAAVRGRLGGDGM
jgi:hypothetical protein